MDLQFYYIIISRPIVLHNFKSNVILQFSTNIMDFRQLVSKRVPQQSSGSRYCDVSNNWVFIKIEINM
jgi:hypothetical protein